MPRPSAERSIRAKASTSSPNSFSWPAESAETTHVSVVDERRNAVALTYTLEYSYGSRIVVPGAGFLLNNEMGDFNPAPGLTTAEGLIGTAPNLAAPGKRMLSSMTPTILAKDGKLFMVTGTPRRPHHHQYRAPHHPQCRGFRDERAGSGGCRALPSSVACRTGSCTKGTRCRPIRLRRWPRKVISCAKAANQGAAEVIVVGEDGILEGGVDRRKPDGGAGVQ